MRDLQKPSPEISRRIAGSVLGAVFLAALLSSRVSAAKPVQPVASNRQDVADVLGAMTHIDGVLIGQNAGHSNADLADGFRRYILQLEKTSGRCPALLGLDYGYDAIPVSLANSNRFAKNFHLAGGLLSISMHPPNPWHRSRANDVDIGRYDDLVSPGSLAYRRWRAMLDRVASGLSELREAGVVVLWRPFHEMNGGWFWWCPERNGNWPTPSQFRAVWRDMFEYFTQEKQLDNLLWVYSAAVQTESRHRSATHFYPGDAYVDIVGLDWYADDLTSLDEFNSYTQVAALGKPIGLTEFGPLKQRDGSFDNRRVLEVAHRFPHLKFVMYWHGWPGNKMALCEQLHARELMLHPDIIDRQELKALRKIATTTEGR